MPGKSSRYFTIPLDTDSVAGWPQTIVDLVNQLERRIGEGGNVPVKPTAANSPTAKRVTFDKPFPVAPEVQVTPNTSVPGTTVTGCSYANVTTTGFDVILTRTNTTETFVSWHAYLPTSYDKP